MKKIVLFLSCLFLFAPVCFGGNWNIQDGISLFKGKNEAEAKTFFENYTKIYPNNPIGFYYLGLIYKNENNLIKSRYNLERAYNLTNDISDFKIAPNVNGLPIEDYLDMANVFLENNDLKSALEYANLIQEIDPDNKEAYLLKTEIYLKMDKRDASYDSFLHVLELDSSYLNSDWAIMLNIKEMPEFNDDYYNSKGLQYFYIGDYKKAQENFELALKVNPKNHKALSNMGNLSLIKNDVANANSYFKKALSYSNSDTSIYRNIAKTDKKNEENYLKKAISINPNDKLVYYQLGKFYIEKGDTNSAITNLKQAVALDKTFVEAYLELIPIYINKKDYNEAIINCRKALNVAPDNAEIYYYIGLLSEKIGKYDEAVEYYLMAIKNAKNKNYYQKAHEMYLKLGEKEKAQEILK